MADKVSETQSLERLTGSVERVTFHNEETGFCVLKVAVKGHREAVPVVGMVPNVVAGEQIEADGHWVVDRDHGRQFKAEHLRTLPPDSIEAIERYLGSGLIRGIGPVYAGKLVEAFGREVFEVIEKRSAELETVEGIGPQRRRQIKESWNETRQVRAIMAFLLGHGVSTARAFRIYRTYGDQAIPTVQSDPYCLARDIKGIGFKTADAIASRMGIEKTSELRARAGVEYVLHELTGQGHCAYPREDLLDEAERVLDIPREIVEQALDHGRQARRVVEEEIEGVPLVYPSPLHAAEAGLAQLLARQARGPHPCPSIRVDAAIAWVEARMKMTLAPAQREALALACRSKVMVVTGGPGVGKTTLVKAILSILEAKKMKLVLCAPTGRAAKRLAETTGREARTIHRLLEVDPVTGAFKHGPERPLRGDVFVVDETSMVDLPLAHSLVRALPPQAALLWVGDADQLPSVGPGSVLRDIMASETVPVVRLTEVFRQAAESLIVANAHRINQGQMPELGGRPESADFFFVPADDPEDAVARIREVVAHRIPRRFRMDPWRDIQVLSPMQRGVLGARNLNVVLQEALNPQGLAVERFGAAYRVGDKVMQTENDYDKDVYNGDIGEVAAIDFDERYLRVSFGGRKVSYGFEELDELAPAYAITIHKSQGSEYPCVVIPVHTQHYVMLQRNLIYTAITRGRRLVVLVGMAKAIGLAVNRKDARRRVTALARRLRDAWAG